MEANFQIFWLYNKHLCCFWKCLMFKKANFVWKIYTQKLWMKILPDSSDQGHTGMNKS